MHFKYRHNFSMSFMKFSQFTNTSVFLNLNATYTQDNITNSKTIDENFVQTITPVNVDYDYGGTAYMAFSSPIRPLGVTAELRTNLSYNRGILFLNSDENKSTRWNNRYTFSIENRLKEKVDWLILILV